MQTQPTTQQTLRAEQVDHLYQRLPFSLIATTIVATILAAVQAQVIAPLIVAGWWLCFVLINGARAVLVWRYRKAQPRPDEIAPWELRFTLTALLIGLCWGATMFLLYPKGSAVHQIFLVLTLIGVSGAGAASLAARSTTAIVSICT